MIRRILRLAERYVSAVERMAASHEASVKIAQVTADAVKRTAQVHERNAERAAAAPVLNLDEVVEALNGVRELLKTFAGRLLTEAAVAAGKEISR